MKEVSREFLVSLLDYDPETGVFVWRKREGSWTNWRWSQRFAGKEAGCLRSDGYRLIMIEKKFHYAHRLAWLYANHEWPHMCIDHINHNPSDNRIANLRHIPKRENHLNMPMIKSNSSGKMGVSFDGRSGKWHARIGESMTTIDLGLHASKEDAIAARSHAEEVYGYHANHGL